MAATDHYHFFFFSFIKASWAERNIASSPTLCPRVHRQPRAGLKARRHNPDTDIFSDLIRGRTRERRTVSESHGGARRAKTQTAQHKYPSQVAPPAVIWWREWRQSFLVEGLRDSQNPSSQSATAWDSKFSGGSPNVDILEACDAGLRLHFLGAWCSLVEFLPA